MACPGIVISVIDGAAASVNSSISTTSSSAAVAEVVRRAENEAGASASAGRARDYAELVTPAEAGGSDAGFHDAGEQTSFAVYHNLLADLAGAFDDARTSDRLLYGFARHEITTTHLGTSTGVRRRWVQPTGTVELNAKSADLTRSSWAGASSSDFVGVDMRAMSAGLANRLAWASRTIELPPGRYDAVLPPTAVADFMAYLSWSIAALPAYEGRSAFAAPGGGTRIGERLTDLPLCLYADPAYPGQEAAPFVVTAASSDEHSVFDNGAKIGRTDLVTAGELTNLVHTRASAREFGAGFTPLADNLVIDGGDPSLTIDDLVAGVGRGLLITSQWYLREVDPMTMLLTGLTRDGVFLIENGEIAGAVNNFRFNMSPLDVLRQAAVVGRTEAGSVP